MNTPLRGGLIQEPLQNIGNNDEEVWGDGIPLSEAAVASEPTARNSIQEDGSLAHVERASDPGAPFVAEAVRPHDAVEAAPGDGVEGLLKVKF